MQVLHQLPKFDDPNILIGIETMGDAGVYKIDEHTALVQSVDILTPIADDPFTFGQIAAANALSDIYAMGARPITALNIMAYNPEKLDSAVVASILAGVARKVQEAGACVIGGHTIKDSEIKCGLAVTGVVSPDNIITNTAARPGDILILTKPLGTGVISTALKNGVASEAAIQKINASMCQLNDRACDAMIALGVTSATDVTGFGLLGHALEMAEGSGVGLIIRARDVPIIDEAIDYAKQKQFPGGTKKNFEYVKVHVSFGTDIRAELQMLLCDAQTSGGLLIAVPEARAPVLLDRLRRAGANAARIGYVRKHTKDRPRIEIQ